MFSLLVSFRVRIEVSIVGTANSDECPLSFVGTGMHGVLTSIACWAEESQGLAKSLQIWTCVHLARERVRALVPKGLLLLKWETAERYLTRALQVLTVVRSSSVLCRLEALLDTAYTGHAIWAWMRGHYGERGWS